MLRLTTVAVAAGPWPLDTGSTPMPPLNFSEAPSSSAAAGNAWVRAASDRAAAMAVSFMSRTSRGAGWTAPGEHLRVGGIPSFFCDTKMKKGGPRAAFHARQARASGHEE